jgi:hypothetical protein
MFDRICRTYRGEAERNSEFAAAAKKVPVEKIIELMTDQSNQQERVEGYRRRSIWVLHPGAWKARLARNAARRQILQLKRHGLDTLNMAAGTSDS